MIIMVLPVDYYFGKTKKAGGRCSATASGFFIFPVLNCAKSLKRLGRKGFVFGHLITPTGNINTTIQYADV